MVTRAQIDKAWSDAGLSGGSSSRSRGRRGSSGPTAAQIEATKTETAAAQYAALAQKYADIGRTDLAQELKSYEQSVRSRGYSKATELIDTQQVAKEAEQRANAKAQEEARLKSMEQQIEREVQDRKAMQLERKQELRDASAEDVLNAIDKPKDYLEKTKQKKEVSYLDRTEIGLAGANAPEEEQIKDNIPSGQSTGFRDRISKYVSKKYDELDVKYGGILPGGVPFEKEGILEKGKEIATNQEILWQTPSGKTFKTESQAKTSIEKSGETGEPFQTYNLQINPTPSMGLTRKEKADYYLQIRANQEKEAIKDSITQSDEFKEYQSDIKSLEKGEYNVSLPATLPTEIEFTQEGIKYKVDRDKDTLYTYDESGKITKKTSITPESADETVRNVIYFQEGLKQISKKHEENIKDVGSTEFINTLNKKGDNQFLKDYLDTEELSKEFRTSKETEKSLKTKIEQAKEDGLTTEIYGKPGILSKMGLYDSSKIIKSRDKFLSTLTAEEKKLLLKSEEESESFSKRGIIAGTFTSGIGTAALVAGRGIQKGVDYLSDKGFRFTTKEGYLKEVGTSVFLSGIPTLPFNISRLSKEERDLLEKQEEEVYITQKLIEREIIEEKRKAGFFKGTVADYTTEFLPGGYYVKEKLDKGLNLKRTDKQIAQEVTDRLSRTRLLTPEINKSIGTQELEYRRGKEDFMYVSSELLPEIAGGVTLLKDPRNLAKISDKIKYAFPKFYSLGVVESTLTRTGQSEVYGTDSRLKDTENVDLFLYAPVTGVIGTAVYSSVKLSGKTSKKGKATLGFARVVDPQEYLFGDVPGKYFNINRVAVSTPTPEPSITKASQSTGGIQPNIEYSGFGLTPDSSSSSLINPQQSYNLTPNPTPQPSRSSTSNLVQTPSTTPQPTTTPEPNLALDPNLTPDTTPSSVPVTVPTAWGFPFGLLPSGGMSGGEPRYKGWKKPRQYNYTPSYEALVRNIKSPVKPSGVFGNVYTGAEFRPIIISPNLNTKKKSTSKQNFSMPSISKKKKKKKNSRRGFYNLPKLKIPKIKF